MIAGLVLISLAPAVAGVLVPALAVIWLATKIPASAWRALLKISISVLALVLAGGLLLHLLPLALAGVTLYITVLVLALVAIWLSTRVIAAIRSLQTPREKMKNDWLYDEQPEYDA